MGNSILGTSTKFIGASVYIGATGNSQSTAAYIPAYYCYVTTGIVGGGVILPPPSYIGETYLVQNDTSNILYCYPNVGNSIDAGEANAPITFIPYGSGQLTAQTLTSWNTSIDPIAGTDGITVVHGFGGLEISITEIAPNTLLGNNTNTNAVPVGLSCPIIEQMLLQSEVNVPTAPGYTVNISNNVNVELIYQEGGAPNSSGVTINFPSTPYTNQQLTIATVSAITGMTLSPGYQIGGAPTSMAANTSIKFIWINSRWNRLY